MYKLIMILAVALVTTSQAQVWERLVRNKAGDICYAPAYVIELADADVRYDGKTYTVHDPRSDQWIYVSSDRLVDKDADHPLTTAVLWLVHSAEGAPEVRCLLPKP
jgi:hypothetical protein